MKKHNALQNAQHGWETFTRFMKWGTIGTSVLIAIVVLIIYY